MEKLVDIDRPLGAFNFCSPFFLLRYESAVKPAWELEGYGIPGRTGIPEGIRDFVFFLLLPDF